MFKKGLLTTLGDEEWETDWILTLLSASVVFWSPLETSGLKKKVGPDLDPKCLSLRYSWKNLLKRFIVEKYQQKTKMYAKLPACKESHLISAVDYFAIDWVSKNWYFTDSLFRRVSVCSTDGKYCVAIVTPEKQKNIVGPKSIVINPLKR